MVTECSVKLTCGKTLNLKTFRKTFSHGLVLLAYQMLRFTAGLLLIPLLRVIISRFILLFVLLGSVILDRSSW